MTKKHKNLQRKIKECYREGYEVLSEKYLPNGSKHWYRPDVILRNKKDNEIAHIYEIEGDPVRKALAGAIILADCCLAELNQKSKPILTFVVYAEKGKQQIGDFKKRVSILKKRCQCLRKINVKDEKELRQELSDTSSR